LKDAIRDGDPIRAVIRGTASTRYGRHHIFHSCL
jgi:acyl transferase domain-containing protein